VYKNKAIMIIMRLQAFNQTRLSDLDPKRRCSSMSELINKKSRKAGFFIAKS
jgi:hypothetical protein